MTCSVRSTSSNSLNHGRMGWMRVQALGVKVCAGRHVFAQVALGDPGCIDSLVCVLAVLGMIKATTV